MIYIFSYFCTTSLCFNVSLYYITWQIQQHNILYDILIVNSSSLKRTSFPTLHVTTWFQTLFLFTSFVYKSFTFWCHKLLTDMVYLNQSYCVVTFSDFFNTPNVTVTGGIWETICLWWKHLLHYNIFIWLPCNRNRNVSAKLFTQDEHEFRRFGVVVEEDCQSWLAIYKATRPGYWIGSHWIGSHEPRRDQCMIQDQRVL